MGKAVPTDQELVEEFRRWAAESGFSAYKLSNQGDGIVPLSQNTITRLLEEENEKGEPTAPWEGMQTGTRTVLRNMFGYPSFEVLRGGKYRGKN